MALADGLNIDAPLNKKAVELVHDVERNNKFFNKEDVIRIFKELEE